MPPSFNLNYENQFRPCECCKLRYTTATYTVSTGDVHKWTKKELESMVLNLAERFSKAKWYERGDLRRVMKHWVEKLDRYNQLKEEFN